MKKTKYSSPNYRGNLTFLNIVFAILIYGAFFVLPTLCLLYFLFHSKEIITIVKVGIDNGAFSFNDLIPLLFLALVYFSLAFSIIGSVVGKIRNFAVNVIFRPKNLYLYFRELPNDFGIGVTSLLFDSTLENEKDIVAVILDLCAKGYLKLEQHSNKYIIKILEKDSSKLLSNELYILNLIKDNKIKDINYKNWYSYCLQDGINLGLYKYQEASIPSIPTVNSQGDPTPKIIKFSAITNVILCMIKLLFSYIEYGFSYSMLATIPHIILDTFMLTFFFCIVILALYGIFSFIMYIFESAYDLFFQAYTTEVNNNLKKTPYGIDELNKLKSFKSFLHDFGNFANKYPEEIVLWDRYLSYAQVFGLTKDIMKTGYTQLVKNSSFSIDSIDNITLYNIELN